MKFIIKKENRKDFIIFLSTVALAARPSKIMESLLGGNGFLLTAGVKNGEGFLIGEATDTIVGTKVKIPIDVEKEGVVVVNTNLLNIIKSLPNEDIIVTQKDNGLEIKYGKSKTILKLYDPEKFVGFPVKKPTKICSLEEADFKDSLRKAITNVSISHHRKVFEGVWLDVTETQINIVGTDTARMSIERLEPNKVDSIDKLIIPKQSADVLIRLLQDTEHSNITIMKEGNNLIFYSSTANWFFMTITINGEWPNYNQIIPQNNKIIVKTDNKELLKAAERTNLISPEDSKSVKVVEIYVREKELMLKAQNQIEGAIEEYITAETEGLTESELIITVNAEFLLNTCRLFPSDEILLKIRDSVSPILIESEEEGYEGFLYILVPMRPRETKSSEENEEKTA